MSSLDPVQIRQIVDVLFPALKNALDGVPVIGKGMAHALTAAQAIIDSPDVWPVVVAEIQATVANTPAPADLAGLNKGDVIPDPTELK